MDDGPTVTKPSRRNIGRALAGAFAVLSLCGSEPPADAHPHVWIEAEVVVPLTEGKVHAIEVRWRFDDAFGAVAIADFDGDGDGRLNAAEAATLAANSLESLRDFGYFTHLALDGEDVDTDRVERLEVREAAGILRYTLIVPLPRPVDPTVTAISFALYDPSYYTEVSLGQIDPVRLVGGWPTGCRPEASEDPRHAIYFGMVYPIRVHLRCPSLPRGDSHDGPGPAVARLPVAGRG